MKHISVWLTCLLAAGSLSAHSLPEGTQELRLQGTLDPATADGSEFELQVSYGYFFVDNVQAGGRLALRDSDSLTSLGLGGYAELNFDTGSELMPFLEGFAGIAHVDYDRGDSDLTGILEGRAGAKFFLSENVAIAGAGVFAWATDDIYADDNDFDDTDVFLELSLRCYFF